MSDDTEANETTVFASRFRGYMPVIIDVETGGFNCATDALLEVAAVTLDMVDDGILRPDATIEFNVAPFEGANLEQSALDFTGIKPDCALRNAVDERQALTDVFSAIRKKVKQYDCKRAIMVGGNYGEVFSNNIGSQTSIGLARGLNAQWKDGGLLYSPPFR